jgi:hypothetical protein
MKHSVFLAILLWVGTSSANTHIAIATNGNDGPRSDSAESTAAKPMGVVEFTAGEPVLSQKHRELLNEWVAYLAGSPGLGLIIGAGPWRDEDGPLARLRADLVRNFILNAVTPNGSHLSPSRVFIRVDLTSCQTAAWGNEDRPVPLRTFALRDGEIGQRHRIMVEKDLCRIFTGTPPN